jgi:hypothetical protein
MEEDRKILSQRPIDETPIDDGSSHLGDFIEIIDGGAVDAAAHAVAARRLQGQLDTLTPREAKKRRAALRHRG